LLALHLHQVERRTFTSKLLSMPSTPLNRYAIASGPRSPAASIIPRGEMVGSGGRALS
jgi:hypothetical protein